MFRLWLAVRLCWSGEPGVEDKGTGTGEATAARELIGELVPGCESLVALDL